MATTVGAVAAALFMMSCGSGAGDTETVTVTPPTVTVTAGPTLRAPSAAGTYADSTFSVGDRPQGGLVASIPPGRYRATLTDTTVPPIMGQWMLCRDVRCGSASSEHIINIGSLTGANAIEIVDVDPSVVAVALSNVTLTPIP